MVAITDTILFANNKIASLNNDVLAGDGSLVLAAGEGAGFPSPAAGQYFVVTLQNLSNGEIEVCYCTGRSGDLLTVQRAQEGTLATGFPSSTSVVQMRLTKGILEKILQRRFTGSDVNKYLRVQANGEVYPEFLILAYSAGDVDKYLRVQGDGSVVPEAAEFQVPAGLSYLDNNETHTAGKATAPVIITASTPATVTLNMAESNAFEILMEANITLAISNAQNGQTLNLLLKQDGVGGRVVTFAGSTWTWPAGTPPTISAAAGAVDMISGRYDTTAARMRAVALQAFA